MNVDYSPEAVTRRLKQVDELRRLCLALAGPRLKWDWRRPPADSPSVARTPDASSVATRTDPHA